MPTLSLIVPSEEDVAREIQNDLRASVEGKTGSPSTWHHTNGDGEQVSGSCGGRVTVTVE